MNYATATWIEILQRTVFPTAAVSVCRFVGDDGNQVSVAGARALGISRGWYTTTDVTNNRGLTVVVLGYGTIESGGNYNVGDRLASDNQGRAIKRTAGQVVNAIACEQSTASGQGTLVLLVQEVPFELSAAIADLGTGGTSTVAQLEAKINGILAMSRAQGFLTP
jgi:hypothetical protein